eukprot:TRINITY_DN14705_c0_g1_i1.p1 TRINITY_DN14705_c0_g1~~TRINITY_DN14705_c0_g1_i1.p1  ORF type:complete len:207 (+),score=57.09 TRINITY_DN14705_c0_g1_i1:70-690(+)
MSFEDRLREVRKRVYRARDGLEALGAGRDLDAAGLLAAECNWLAREFEELRGLLPLEARRELWKGLLHAAESEFTDVRRDLDKYITRAHQRTVAEQRREELLGGYLQDREHMKNVQLLGEERTGISKSRQGIANIRAEGNAVLEALEAQRDMLGSTQHKLRRFGDTLGLSQSILNTIHRTNLQSRWMVYAGMVVITSMLLIIWWWA